MARDGAPPRRFQPTQSTKAFCLESYSCGLLLIERFDFTRIAGSDRISFEFSVHREKPVIRSERFRGDKKRLHALVVRKTRIHGVQSRLHVVSVARSGDHSRKKPATVAN